MMNDVHGVPPHLLLEVFTTLGKLFRRRLSAATEPHAETPVNDMHGTRAKRPAFLRAPTADRKAA